MSVNTATFVLILWYLMLSAENREPSWWKPDALFVSRAMRLRGGITYDGLLHSSELEELYQVIEGNQSTPATLEDAKREIAQLVNDVNVDLSKMSGHLQNMTEQQDQQQKQAEDRSEGESSGFETTEEESRDIDEYFEIVTPDPDNPKFPLQSATMLRQVADMSVTCSS
eukprot:766752-Hanusia_phi.AAC.15